MKKFLFVLVITVLNLMLLQAQKKAVVNADMDELDVSWFTVLSGQPQGIPVKTGYGFVVPQDNRILAGYSKEGNALWQQRLSKQPEDIVCAKNDFLYITSQSRYLSLLNPSGYTLWQTDTGFQIFSKILCGKDGRVFVRSKDSVTCYGINGTKKWSLNTGEQMNFDSVTLNDGSLLIFLTKQVNSKSFALRISPFGEILEEIVFQGTAARAFSTGDGVILVFTDGSVGMCSIDSKTGLIVSSWVNKNLIGSQKSCCIQKDSSTVYFFDACRLCKVNTENGQIVDEFYTDINSRKNLTIFENSDTNFVLADNQRVCLYTDKGEKLKDFSLPSPDGRYKWNYMFYTDHGELVFLSKTWTVNSFKFTNTSRDIEKTVFTSYPSKQKPGVYSEFIKPFENRSLIQISPDWANILTCGNCATDEIDITENVIYTIDTYLAGQDQKQNRYSGFEGDFNKIELTQAVEAADILGFIESDIAFDTIAQIILKAKDPSLICQALKQIQVCGYDPTGEILVSLENLVRKTNPSQKYILEECCKSIYHLCRFMGRPALNTRGKIILSRMISQGYAESTKKQARTAFEKLAELKM